jgi:hypothetical protein
MGIVVGGAYRPGRIIVLKGNEAGFGNEERVVAGGDNRS